MDISQSEFIISATKQEQYPKENLPEIVLLGKSNVGKSSFINCICNKNKLAKTSSTPGKTKQINFYKLNNIIHLVDLPGYGFSKMSKDEENVIANYINEYLENSKNIHLIFFLIDIRHEPTSDDMLMFNWLVRNNHKFILIANKSDKIAKTKIDEQLDMIRKSFRIVECSLNIPILSFSSINKQGKDEILDIIEKIL